MLLKSLILKNFKGVKHFNLLTEGKDVVVFGANGSGKTTLQDGFLWLLFNKDSQNRTDFAIKPLDVAGNELHNLVTSVEGLFEINGKQVVIKKEYKEKYASEKGKLEKVFKGHETKYFIDGVPATESEYKNFISGLIDENIFKLLTNVEYFNSLKWQEKRNLLIELVGGISAEEVIASSKELVRLPELLQDRDPEKFKKSLQAHQKELKKEIETLPVRIDEAQRSLPEVGEVREELLNGTLANLKTMLTEKQQELARVEAGGEAAENKRELSIIEGKKIDLRNEYSKKHNEQIKAKQDEQNIAIKGMYETKTAIELKEASIRGTENVIYDIEKIMCQLRDEYKKLKKETFEFSQESVCPTCGQEIPESQLEEARQKALEEFNTSKAEKLKAINEKGKKLKVEVDEHKLKVEVTQKEIERLETEKEKYNKQYQKLDQQITKLREATNDLTAVKEYHKLLMEEEAIKNEIAGLAENNEKTVSKIVVSIEELNVKIHEGEMGLLEVKNREQGLNRIAELMQKEKELAKEFEQVEGNLYLVELFSRTKTQLLETKINSKFSNISFKLFNHLISGGTEECCVATVNGVPFESVNRGGRIKAGLEIISVMQEFHNFNAPVFLDNRESTVVIPQMNCQIINLYVSEADKELRVEIENKQEVV